MKNSQGNAPTALRDFKLLWTGQTLSLFGDQLLVVALPLLAIAITGVTVSEAALLRFAFYMPFLLFGLLAGVFVDRVPRRGMMIICDTIQAITFTLIAVLSVLQLLTLPLLLCLVSIVGITVVFFQVAYTSYLPELFYEAQDLQRNNMRLFFSESITRMMGPMAAGFIIASCGVGSAIGVNAATFVFSLLCLLAIKHRVPKRVLPVQSRQPNWLYNDIREGLRFVFQHPKLAPVISCGFVYVLFLSIIESCLVLYCRTVLGLSAVYIGLVMGATMAGFPVGNYLSTKLVERFGSSFTLVISASVSVIGLVFIPIAGSLSSIAGLVIASIVHGVGEGAFAPTSLTLRQTETPDHLLGRVNSVQRFLLWGAIPIGSLLSAAIIQFSSISVALWIGGIGPVLCLIPLLRNGILSDLLKFRRVTSNPELI